MPLTTFSRADPMTDARLAACAGSGGGSRLDAPPRWMQPFDAWVKRGVCHDPLSFASSSPLPFYKNAMRRGKVGIDFRRQRKWCDPKYELRLDID